MGTKTNTGIENMLRKNRMAKASQFTFPSTRQEGFNTSVDPPSAEDESLFLFRLQRDDGDAWRQKSFGFYYWKASDNPDLN